MYSHHHYSVARILLWFRWYIWFLETFRVVQKLLWSHWWRHVLRTSKLWWFTNNAITWLMTCCISEIISRAVCTILGYLVSLWNWSIMEINEVGWTWKWTWKYILYCTWPKEIDCRDTYSHKYCFWRQCLHSQQVTVSFGWSCHTINSDWATFLAVICLQRWARHSAD